MSTEPLGSKNYCLLTWNKGFSASTTPIVDCYKPSLLGITAFASYLFYSLGSGDLLSFFYYFLF